MKTFEQWQAEILASVGREIHDDEKALAGRQGYDEGLSVQDILDALKSNE